METDEIVHITSKLDNLRLLLMEFRNSSSYKDNSMFFRSMIPNLEMVIALTDKGIIDKRPITEDEQWWFDGDRFVSEAFSFRDDDKPKEIYLHYREICRYAKKKSYFK